MVTYGKISEIDETKGLYRVQFDELDIVSDWLPRILLNTKENKDEAHFDTNEHVACIMDEHLERGVILGAINDEGSLPVAADKNIRRTTYKDGTFVQFNRSTKEYTINSQGKVIVEAATDVEITCNKLKVTGDVEVTGKIDATQDITSLTEVTAGLLQIKLTLHKHPYVNVTTPATTSPAIP